MTSDIHLYTCMADDTFPPRRSDMSIPSRHLVTCITVTASLKPWIRLIKAWDRQHQLSSCRARHNYDYSSWSFLRVARTSDHICSKVSPKVWARRCTWCPGGLYAIAFSNVRRTSSRNSCTQRNTVFQNHVARYILKCLTLWHAHSYTTISALRVLGSVLHLYCGVWVIKQSMFRLTWAAYMVWGLAGCQLVACMPRDLCCKSVSVWCDVKIDTARNYVCLRVYVCMYVCMYVCIYIQHATHLRATVQPCLPLTREDICMYICVCLCITYLRTAVRPCLMLTRDRAEIHRLVDDEVVICIMPKHRVNNLIPAA